VGRDLHGRGRWWATAVLARGGRLALKRGAQVRAAPEEPEKLRRSWRGKRGGDQVRAAGRGARMYSLRAV